MLKISNASKKSFDFLEAFFYIEKVLIQIPIAKAPLSNKFYKTACYSVPHIPNHFCKFEP